MRDNQRHAGARRLFVTFALGGVDLGTVAVLRPDWTRLGHDVAQPHRWVDRVGADHACGTLVSAALWLAALWLAIGLVAALAAELPGRVGDVGRRAANLVLPAVLARAVAGAVGLSVVLAPVAAGAATTSPGPSAMSNAVSATPSWPTDTTPPNPLPMRVPAPTLPNSSPTAVPTTAPATTPATTLAGTPPAAAPPTPSGSEPGASVTVTAGDSLWLIAAHRLGPDATDAQIDATWKQWYAANSAVIGGDPSVIHPGVVLHAPFS